MSISSCHCPPVTRLARALVGSLLLACLVATAYSAQVDIITVAPVADEASLTPADVQFQRDSSSGTLTIYFTLSGTATQTLVPSFSLSSTATLTMASATTGTIVVNNADSSEDLIITPIDNHLITGDLQLVITINADPNAIYSVIASQSAAQIDIAEGDASASVAVPAPVASKNTAIVGGAADPGAPRRGVLEVQFSPATVSAADSQYIYLGNSSGPAIPSGSVINFSPSGATGTLMAAFTGAPGVLSLANPPGLSTPCLIGDRVTSPAVPTFSALVGYDKSLKVQFSGTAPLPSSSQGSATTSDPYEVAYKIGGSRMGSATNPISNGTGYNAVAYPIGSTSVFIDGSSGSLAAGAVIYFANNPAITYTLSTAFTATNGSSGSITIPAPGLTVSVHDGDSVNQVGTTFSGTVFAPILPGTTTLSVENGIGTLKRGDVFTLAGEQQTTPQPRYVITATVPAVGVNGSGSISFRRYTGGTITADGVNDLHSAAAQLYPSPVLSTSFLVTGDITDQANLSSTGGIFQLLVPAESTLVDFGINPLDNGLTNGAATGEQTVDLNLYADLNYAALSPTSGELIIADSDATASIQATGNAIQGATQATSTDGTFVISLSAPLQNDTPISFTTAMGSGAGIAGIDYLLLSTANLVTSGNLSTVTLPAGQTQIIIQVEPSYLANLGTGETVTLTLSPSYNYLLADTTGSLNASATLSLLPTPPATPVVTISLGHNAVQPVAYNGTETVGTFIVSSLTPVPNNVVVTYTLGGTAVTGTDYQAPAGYMTGFATGTVTIPANQTTATISIDPNVNPLPGYKANDIVLASLQITSGSHYTLSPITSASLSITQSQVGVTSVASSASGTYYPGNQIPIVVTFSAPITVNASGTPNITLPLTTGTTNGVATYASSSGSTITLSYTVQIGDATSALDYTSAATLVLGSGTTLSQTSGNAGAVLTQLPTPPGTKSLSGSTTIVLDGRPAISITASGSPAEYPIASPTPGFFTIASTPAIPVGQTFTVNYTLGGSAVAGTDYASPVGVGSVTLISSASSQVVTILPINNPIYTPDEQVIGTLTANALYRIGTPATATLTIAQSVIAVTSVTTTSQNATYTTGQQIPITVTFSSPVTVAGTPTLALNTGATNAVATYSSGSGSAALVFIYTVGVDDMSPKLEYLSSSALSVGAGSITDAGGNGLTVSTTLPAPGAAGSLSSASALVIDGTPTISFSVAAHTNPAEGTPVTNGKFTITCTPAPQIPLTVVFALGGTAVIGQDIAQPGATFANGIGQVTIPASTTTPTVPTTTTSIPLTIVPLDGATTRAGVTVIGTIDAATGYHLGTPITDTLTITQNSIAVLAVGSLDAAGTYTFGETLTLTVTFTQAVQVSGTPLLALATGTTPAEATYSSGTGTNVLSFTYVIGAGDTSADLDYVSTTSLSANGGSITGTGAQIISLALPALGGAASLAPSNLVIDGTLPAAGKPPPGSITGPGAGSGGGCGLGSGLAAFSALLVLALRQSLTRCARRRRV